MFDARWALLRDYDFDSVAKHMSHVWRARDDDAYMVAAKGALEGILARHGNAHRTKRTGASARLVR